MATAMLWAAGLVALSVAFFWVAFDLQRQQRYSNERIEQVMASHLLAPTLELQAPFTERVLRPLLKRFLRRIGSLSPTRNMERLRRQLLIAGSPYGLSPLDFIGLRLLIALVGLAGLGAMAFTGSGPYLRRLVVFLIGALICFQLPNYWLRRRMRIRREAIALALPDALDMLTVCIDAGMGLENAFLRIGQIWNHALAQEFQWAVMEMGVGVSWREAMRHMVYRTDVADLSSLVAVLLQADQLGFSISDTLHTQADQLRTRRWQRAQELARAAPFKMLFPMVFFIMPATFAIVLGPALPALSEVLGSL